MFDLREVFGWEGWENLLNRRKNEEDSDWSFNWHPFAFFGLGAESSWVVPITSPLFNQFFGYWDKEYINQLIESAGPGWAYEFLTFIDLTWCLTEDQNNKGIYYLKNCTVKQQP